MVGSAIRRYLTEAGYNNLLFKTRTELDLKNQQAVSDFFASHRPDYVFLAAAKVGGIMANNSLPAEFIHQNLVIQTNIIHQAKCHDVKRLLFLGSSCIYPRDCPQPMEESALLTGPLEITNRPYAVAKISGIEMCWSYYRQYRCQYLCAMPTNLYGPGDSYDLNHSHIIPALIHKFHLAKTKGHSSVPLWGTGSPRREFLYCEDLAEACVHLMNLDETSFSSLFSTNEPPLINIGCGRDLIIRDLANIVAGVVGYAGTINWQYDKPDGTPRKLLDVNKINRLGWKASTPLKEGLEKAYQDFHNMY